MASPDPVIKFPQSPPDGSAGGGPVNTQSTPVSRTSEEISRAYAQFNGYLFKGMPQRAREKLNHDLNDGTENRHWGLDDAMYRTMANEGRSATTINFVKQGVATMAGAIVMDKFQGEFMSGYGESEKDGDGIRELQLRDAQLGGWDEKVPIWVREAFIYRGTLAWYINTDVDPRGALDLEHIPADRIVYDPNWMTTDVNDNNEIFEYTYKTARRIVDDHGDQNPWLVRRLRGDTSFTYGYSASTGLVVRSFDEAPQLRIDLDGELLVINKYWLERATEYRIFDAGTGLYRDDIPHEFRRDWVKNERLAGGLETTGLVSLVPVKRWIEKFISFCPSLSTDQVLSEGDYPLQLNGYHFCPITSDLLNGKPNTITDQYSDPQRMVNKRMSTETYILATSSTNGMLANPKMFLDNAEYDRWVNEGHKPGYKGALSDAASQMETKFLEIPKSQAQQGYLESTNAILKMVPKLGPNMDALGGTAQPQQSGIAYQAQVNQANVTLVIPKTFIKQAFRRLHNQYFEGCKFLYTFPITVPGSQDNAVYAFNQGPGSISIPDIARMKITVEESPTSQSKRSVMVSEAAGAMQYLDAGSLQKHELAGVIAENLPHLSDADRARVKAANDIERKNLLLDAKVKELQYMVAVKNAEAQLQSQGGPPPSPPAKGAMTITGKFEDMTSEQWEIAYANGYERPQAPPKGEAPAAPGTAGGAPAGGPMPAPPSAPGGTPAAASGMPGAQ